MALDFSQLLNAINSAINSSEEPLQAICNLLKKEVPHYNWVGFYFMNESEKLLELGPYAGAETNHTRIPYGKGICGQVALSGESFLSPDVKAEDNYLACSIETKAELVVPMFSGNTLIGQLDIDSHTVDPFTADDEEFLKKVCELAAQVYKPTF